MPENARLSLHEQNLRAKIHACLVVKLTDIRVWLHVCSPYLLIAQGMLDATIVSTMSSVRTLHFNDLPDDIQIRIFERLSVQERARIAAVCRTWDQVSNANWTSVDLLGKGMKEVRAWLDWLRIISKQSSETLRNVDMRMFPLPGDFNKSWP